MDSQGSCFGFLGVQEVELEGSRRLSLWTMEKP